MARATYVIRDGQLVEKRYARPLSVTNIRSDGMDATWNPMDGRTYDSKSAYYGAVKRGGGEIMGNDTSTLNNRRSYEPSGVEMSIKQAIQQLQSR